MCECEIQTREIPANVVRGEEGRSGTKTHLVECHCPHKLTVAWSLVTMREKSDLDGSLPNMTSSRSTIALLTAETWSLWHTM